jgi:hypothetical protein
MGRLENWRFLPKTILGIPGYPKPMCHAATAAREAHANNPFQIGLDRSGVRKSLAGR